MRFVRHREEVNYNSGPEVGHEDQYYLIDVGVADLVDKECHLSTFPLIQFL